MQYDLKALTLSFNELLADLYGCEKRVSGILSDFGLEKSCIDSLKGDNLAVFYGNIKFALECRFLHYSGGYRLLDILFRRYGLFGYKKETLEEIGKSMGLSRERIRQLQNKAIKRMIGSVAADATAVFILLSACQTVGIDAMKYLENHEPLKTNLLETTIDSADEITEQTQSDAENDVCEVNIESQKPVELPKVAFYISSGFDYYQKHGKYRMFIEHGEEKRYIEKQNLEGHSDVNMILLAVIEGLGLLRYPSNITVYSNTLFGVTSMYNKGILRQEVPSKASNYELKEKICSILREYGHKLSNIADNDIKTKLDTFMAQQESFGTPHIDQYGCYYSVPLK